MGGASATRTPVTTASTAGTKPVQPPVRVPAAAARRAMEHTSKAPEPALPADVDSDAACSSGGLLKSYVAAAASIPATSTAPKGIAWAADPDGDGVPDDDGVADEVTDGVGVKDGGAVRDGVVVGVARVGVAVRDIVRVCDDDRVGDSDCAAPRGASAASTASAISAARRARIGPARASNAARPRAAVTTLQRCYGHAVKLLHAADITSFTTTYPLTAAGPRPSPPAVSIPSPPRRSTLSQTDGAGRRGNARTTSPPL